MIYATVSGSTSSRYIIPMAHGEVTTRGLSPNDPVAFRWHMLSWQHNTTNVRLNGLKIALWPLTIDR